MLTFLSIRTLAILTKTYALQHSKGEHVYEALPGLGGPFPMSPADAVASAVENNDDVFGM